MAESYDAGTVVIQTYSAGAITIQDYEAGAFVVPQNAAIPWTPSEILADLFAWYDPSDNANLTLAGAEVNGLTDLSGNARHLGVTGTGSITNAGAINGVQGVRAIGDQKRPFLATTWNPRAYFFVGSTSDTIYIVLTGDGASKFELVAENGSAVVSNAGSTQTAFRVDGTTVTVPANRNAVHDALLGAHVGYSETTLSSWSAVGLMGYTAVGGFAYTGDYGEWIFLNAIPTTDTRQKLEGYLCWKWGTNANLDPGHPYFAAAPTL
jgi:hypothetical protein